jgi:hypothetical protein
MISDWTSTTTNAVRDSLSNVISYIPEIIAAFIVILIGVIVAWAVKTIIVRVLSFIKLKKYTDAVGLDKVFTQKVELVELLGDLAKWIVIIIFLLPALEILKLNQVGDVVTGVINYIPNVIVAVVVVMVGIIIADLASRVVKSTAGTLGTHTADILADVAKWAIIIFATLAALVQLGIGADLIQTLWQGLVYLVVLAGAIAFGLGGKDQAAAFIDRMIKNLPKNSKK